MSASKERWRRRVAAIGLLAALALAPAVLAGCGGSDGGGQTSERTAAEGLPHEASQGVANQGHEAEHRRSHQAQKSKGDDGASAKGEGDRGNRRHGAEEKHGAGGSGTRLPTKADGHCPANVTREQCKAIAAQPVSKEPSQPLHSTSDCVEAMGKAACQQSLEAEKGAAEAKGDSVSVENCLEERTRAQCEAQLGASLESEYANSKGE